MQDEKEVDGRIERHRGQRKAEKPVTEVDLRKQIVPRQVPRRSSVLTFPET